MEYIDQKGRRLFISDGISSGAKWGTFFCKPNGSLKRIKSTALPMRRAKEAAQADLDQYAMRKGIEGIE